MSGKIFRQSFFKDRVILRLVFVYFVLFVIALIVIFINLEARNDKVPVRYSNFAVGFFDRENWTAQYVFPVFASVVFFVNAYLTTKLHAMQKEYSYAWMSLSIILMIFTILVSQAIIGFSIT